MDAVAGNVDEFEAKVAVKREGEEQSKWLEKNKKKKGSCSTGRSGMMICQVDKCDVELHDAKQYHRRHKVCEFHAKAKVVIMAGMPQRFCQQCSRFQELAEFDDTKRSCRKRLAGHNERRRKNFESQAEVLSHKGTVPELKDKPECMVDDQESIHISIQANASNFFYR